MKHRALILVPLMALTGCATMSVDECATADWRVLGFTDGSRGETLARTERRANDCAAHGYTIDRVAYDGGRHAGLSQYCTSATAYRGNPGGPTMVSAGSTTKAPFSIPTIGDSSFSLLALRYRPPERSSARRKEDTPSSMTDSRSTPVATGMRA